MSLLSVFKYPFGLLFQMETKLIYIIVMKDIETRIKETVNSVC